MNTDRKIKSDSKYLPSKKTNIINASLKFNKLESIFKKLDGNGDGYISADKINISNVSVEVLEIISPLLIEIEEANIEVDME